MSEQRLHTLKVVHATHLAPQILQLLLQPEMPIRYQAGDYLMLGFEEQDLKPFSIAAAPREDGLLECHIRNQADSEWMQKLFSVSAGDQLVMHGPKPQMQIQGCKQPMIFVAGGTGFAPMKALLEELLRQNCTQPMQFYWGARSSADLYMHQQMLELANHYEHLSYIPVISDDCSHWQGATGLVHQQVLAEHNDLSPFMVYLCGPWAMNQTAKQAFIDAGLSPEHFIS